MGAAAWDEPSGSGIAVVADGDTGLQVLRDDTVIASKVQSLEVRAGGVFVKAGDSDAGTLVEFNPKDEASRPTLLQNLKELCQTQGVTHTTQPSADGAEPASAEKKVNAVAAPSGLETGAPAANFEKAVDDSAQLCAGSFGVCHCGTGPASQYVIARAAGNTLAGDVALLSSVGQHRNIAKLASHSNAQGDVLWLSYISAPVHTTLHLALVDDTTAAKLTWPTRISIALGITRALQHLNSLQPPLTHRDVTSRNVLLQGGAFVPKLLWAGMSSLIDPKEPFGTAGYLAPEYSSGQAAWSVSAEVFSLGVVMGEIVSGMTPSGDEHLILMSDMRLDEVAEMVEPLTALSERCRDDDVASRPTYAELVAELEGTPGSDAHDNAPEEDIPPTPVAPPSPAPPVDSPPQQQQQQQEPEQGQEPPLQDDAAAPPLQDGEKEEAEEKGKAEGDSGEAEAVAEEADAPPATDGSDEGPVLLEADEGSPAMLEEDAQAEPQEVLEGRLLEAVGAASGAQAVLIPARVFSGKGADLAEGAFGVVSRLPVGGKNVVVAYARVLAEQVDAAAAAARVAAIHNEVGVPLAAYSPIANGSMWLAYRASEETTLMDYLVTDSLAVKLTWPTRISIALGITRALQHLNSLQPPLTHRDVTSRNVLLQGGAFVPKLLWAGMSSLIDPKEPFGTAGYLAPEYSSGQAAWSVSAEVFSLGVVMGEIVSGTLATAESVGMGLMSISDMRLVDDTAEVVDTLTSLSEKCMHENPSMRPNYAEAASLLSRVEQAASPEPPVQQQQPAAVAQPAAIVQQPAPVAAMDPPKQPTPPQPAQPAQGAPEGACHMCWKKLPATVTKLSEAGFQCPAVPGVAPRCFACNQCLSAYFKKNFDANVSGQGIKCTRCNQKFQDEVINKKFIEDEGNAYFAKIYKGDMRMEELIEVLRKYKNYGERTKEHLVYRCMIQCLFSELNYLDNYPPKELKVTADLLGGLIASKALKDDSIKEALQFIVQKLATLKPQVPLDSQPPPVRFAVWSLSHFMPRLPEWDQFREALKEVLNVQALCALLPGLDAHLGVRRPSPAPAPAPEPALPPQKPAAPTGPQERTIGSAHIFDISTIESGRQHVKPDQETQDRLSFVTNNVDKNNIDTCVREVQEVLRPEWVGFFGEYMVVKRASLEPNFHKLYMELLDKVGNKALSESVVVSTVHAVKQLLASDKCRDPSERTLLKNLGSWLGLLTVGRNRPLMARRLDLKGMLRGSVAEGMLPVVLPFVVKIIEHVVHSPLFRPPNPWTMQILHLMGDIYSLKIKLMLKFEVEVLCKNLDLDLSASTDPTPQGQEQRRRIHALYEDAEAGLRPKPENLEPVVKPRPFTTPPKPVASAEPVQVQATAVPAGQQQQPPQQKVEEWGAQKPTGEGEAGWINMSQQAGAEKKIWRDNFRKSFEEQVQVAAAYKETVANAMERATKEVIRPVVERSICIARTATVELVTKDFALDQDKEKMHEAAQMMVKCLVAHLANVTCKEMLKQSLRKELCKDLNRPDKDGGVEDMVRDNLDVCMRLIEKVAVHEASSDIKEHLAKKGTVQLPDVAMRLPPEHRPEVLQALHMKVYHDFERMQSTDNGSQEETQKAIERLLGILLGIEQAAESHYEESTPSDDNMLSLTNQNFTQQTQSVHHESIKKYLCSIPSLIMEDHAPAFAETIFTMVFEIDNRIAAEKEKKKNNEPCNGLYVAMLLNEVCLFILQSVRERKAKITADLTKQYLRHERRWKAKDIAVNFIRLKLIDVAEFDSKLTEALQVNEPQRQVVEFASGIVQKCLLDEKLTSQKDLKQTLEALTHIANKGSKKQQQQQQQQQLAGGG